MKQRLTALGQKNCRKLSDAMLKLLETTQLEKISVIDICTEAQVPRATFYNYFEDKFDLLRYVFRLVAQEIIPKEATDSIDSAIKLFEKLINIVETSDNYLSRIVSANYNGIFFSEIKQFVYEQLLLRFERDMKRGITFNIDIKMLSEFLANGYVYSAKTIIEHQNGIDINELREGIMKVTLSTYTSFTNLLNG